MPLTLDGLENLRPRHPDEPQRPIGPPNVYEGGAPVWRDEHTSAYRAQWFKEHPEQLPWRKRPEFIAWCWRLEDRARRLDEWIEGVDLDIASITISVAFWGPFVGLLWWMF